MFAIQVGGDYGPTVFNIVHLDIRQEPYWGEGSEANPNSPDFKGLRHKHVIHSLIARTPYSLEGHNLDLEKLEGRDIKIIWQQRWVQVDDQIGLQILDGEDELMSEEIRNGSKRRYLAEDWLVELFSPQITGDEEIVYKLKEEIFDALSQALSSIRLPEGYKIVYGDKVVEGKETPDGGVDSR